MLQSAGYVTEPSEEGYVGMRGEREEKEIIPHLKLCDGRTDGKLKKDLRFSRCYEHVNIFLPGTVKLDIAKERLDLVILGLRAEKEFKSLNLATRVKDKFCNGAYQQRMEITSDRKASENPFSTLPKSCNCDIFVMLA